MESNTNSSPVSRMVSVLLFFAGLLGVYYLYNYLFGPRTFNTFALIDKTQKADIDPAKPITIASNKMPTLYEGGEFSISTWIYINNWSYRRGYNKSILRIGSSLPTGFDSIRIYLGGYKPKLMVRLHTMDKGAPMTSTTQGTDTAETESLSVATLNAMFNVQQMDSGLLDPPVPSGCDLPEVDLQRWVNITVSVNGKTVDVYLDGKLSRSCVLPNNFKVDGSYSGYLLSNGGFGGQIANTMMYDTALNPEIVYKNYIAGPDQITGIWQWFTSFFDTGVDVTVSTK
jgi:hypothetical protein